MGDKDNIINGINEIIRHEGMDIINYYLVEDNKGMYERYIICIVVEELKQRKINLTKTIRKKLFREINFPLDIFIYEKEEFKEKSSLPGSIEYYLKEKGVFINGQEKAFC